MAEVKSTATERSLAIKLSNSARFTIDLTALGGAAAVDAKVEADGSEVPAGRARADGPNIF